MGKEGDIGKNDERSFRKLLKEYRSGANVSASVLAKRIGTDTEYIKKLESGLRRPPPLAFLRFMVKELELDDKKADALFVAAEYRPLSEIKRNEDILEQMKCHGFERPSGPTDDLFLSDHL